MRNIDERYRFNDDNSEVKHPSEEAQRMGELLRAPDVQEEIARIAEEAAVTAKEKIRPRMPTDSSIE